ncbi:MAG: ABC transporter permease, partial [Conexibacter sp.]
MKLSNVAGLYAMRLRAQLGQELLALIGIAVGVSLLFAALVANTSLTGSFERVSSGVIGDARLQLAARGGAFLPDEIAAVRRIPGVAAAAGVLEARGEVRGPRGRRSIELIGVTPDFAQLNGSLTHGFSYAFFVNVRAIALPTPLADSLGLALGELATFDLGGRRVTARIAARLQSNEAGGLFTSPIAIAPLPYAQELSGHEGQVSRIFVRPLPGRDAAVAQALRRLVRGRADVVPARHDAALFRQASQPTNQSTTMFSVFSAMVGFLFALSAVLLTVPQRRRLVADLRVEGYGPGTILKVLGFEALALGIVASALGILLGDQFARHLFSQPTFLQMAFPYGSGRIVTFSSVALAAAGGILASLIAVLGPMASSFADREDRAATVAHHGVETGIVLAGATLLAAGVAIVVVTPRSAAVAILGLGCLTLAMLLLLPRLLGSVVAGLDALTRGARSIVAFLAITDLRDPATRLRSLAVAATGAVAVFGSVALQGAHADLQRGLDRTSADLAAIGDLWVVVPGSANLLATAPFPAPTLRPPRRVISRIASYRGSFLDIGARRVFVYGAPATAHRPIPHA